MKHAYTYPHTAGCAWVKVHMAQPSAIGPSAVASAQVISEGIHWKELMDPLAENMGSWVRVVFVAFTGGHHSNVGNGWNLYGDISNQNGYIFWRLYMWIYGDYIEVIWGYSPGYGDTINIF